MVTLISQAVAMNLGKHYLAEGGALKVRSVVYILVSAAGVLVGGLCQN